MGVRVDWADEAQTIVFYDFDEHWTWDEVRAAVERGLALEHGVTYRVDAIIDASRSGPPPANVFGELMKIVQDHPDNLYVSVFVTRSSVVTTIIELVRRFSNKARRYYRVVPTVDEAYQLIDVARNGKAITHEKTERGT